MTAEKSIKVSPELRERIKEEAWRRRTTSSALIGELVKAVAAATLPETKPEPVVSLKFYNVDEKAWKEARKKTSRANMSMAEALEAALEDLATAE